MMLTVDEDTENIFNALTAGASGYMLKRTPAKELLEAIRDASIGNTPLSGPIALRVMEYFHKIGPTTKEAEDLSSRERQVLDLLAMGFIYKEIGIKLDISAETSVYCRR